MGWSFTPPFMVGKLPFTLVDLQSLKMFFNIFKKEAAT